MKSIPENRPTMDPVLNNHPMVKGSEEREKKGEKKRGQMRWARISQRGLGKQRNTGQRKGGLVKGGRALKRKKKDRGLLSRHPSESPTCSPNRGPKPRSCGPLQGALPWGWPGWSPVGSKVIRGYNRNVQCICHKTYQRTQSGMLINVGAP